MKKMKSIVALITMTLALGTNVSADELTRKNPLPDQSFLHLAARSNNYIGNKELITYQAIPVKMLNQSDAQELLGRIMKSTRENNSSFEKVQQLTGRFIFTSVNDPSAVFDIDQKNGSFLLNFGLGKYTAEESTSNLPSVQAAPELARKYLSETGNMPKNSNEMLVAHVGGLDMSVSKEGKSTGAYKKLVTVQFSRKLNGLPVQGPGSRIVMHLGENGNLTGMIRNWPQVEARKIQPAELKSDELIRKDIRSQLCALTGHSEKNTDQKSTIVLFDDGRGVIEPALFVTAKALYQGPNNREVIEIPVDFYVPLLRKPKAYYPFMQSLDSKIPGIDKQQKPSETILSPKTGEGQSDMR